MSEGQVVNAKRFKESVHNRFTGHCSFFTKRYALGALRFAACVGAGFIPARMVL
jgi:hypothetical protein